MAVNLLPPDARTIREVPGVELGIAMAGIKRAGRRDLLVLRLAPGSHTAAVFTKNRFCAAPVVVCREHLAVAEPAMLVVNTGNANAGTADEGLARAREVCRAVAKQAGCLTEAVLPFSTGVIMEPLPIDRIIAAIPAAMANLKADNWVLAAEAIMTTDTVPKAASRQVRIGGRDVTVTGIAKGAGMIRPDMATMLGYIACDAAVSKHALQSMLGDVVADSFNAATVDGDTSTNDSLVLIATGAAGAVVSGVATPEYEALKLCIAEVAQVLAQAIIRDGEGATKFVTVRVEGGRTRDECRAVAYSIAHSPLVKTAFFASDPNLGRILAAIGNSGIADLDPAKVELFLDDVLVALGGGRATGYSEEQGAAVLRKSEFTVRVRLNRGTEAAQVWTTDLSFDYVKINAEYRT